MRSRTRTWNSIMRQLLLISIFFIIYSGPAAAIGLTRFLDEEIFGASSAGEWFWFVVVIWLFAIPFGVAYARWNDDRTATVISLGFFLGLLALFWVVDISIVRITSGLVVAPALWLPFSWMDGLGSPAVLFWSARVCTFAIMIAIPMGALLFQIVQMNQRPEH